MRVSGGNPAASLKLCALVVVAMFAVIAPARAVDIINRDKVAREVVLNGNDGASSVLTLKPQEKATGVCKACVVLSGKTSVEATGSATVMIEGGKVSIVTQR